MLLIALLAACNNECDYFSACDGSTLLVCGEAVDQQVNRKIHEVPCEAPNDVCVTMDDMNGSCAADATACTEGDAATCAGDVLLVCTPALQTYNVSDGSVAQDIWLLQGTDCTATGLTCGVDKGGAAACVSG